MGNFAGFNICFQLLPCRAIEIAAAPTVIGVMLDISVTFLLSIAFEVFFLIDNAVAIANLVIVKMCIRDSPRHPLWDVPLHRLPVRQ